MVRMGVAGGNRDMDYEEGFESGELHDRRCGDNCHIAAEDIQTVGTGVAGGKKHTDRAGGLEPGELRIQRRGDDCHVAPEGIRRVRIVECVPRRKVRAQGATGLLL